MINIVIFLNVRFKLIITLVSESFMKVLPSFQSLFFMVKLQDIYFRSNAGNY